MNRLIPVLLIVVLTGFSSCSDSEDNAAKAGRDRTWDQGSFRLAKDMRLLQSFSSELKDLAEEMTTLQSAIKLKERGYYTADEHDKIESLLFRYLIYRESLWEMIHYYQDYRDHFSDAQNRIKGFILGFDAALHLANYSSILVATFLDNEVVIDKLNEEYYRSGIPRGTYDTLFSSLTGIKNIEALKTARELYLTEMADHESLLYEITESEPDYIRAAGQVETLYKDVDERIQYILERKSLLLPSVRNRLRHSVIVKLAQKAGETIGDNLYAVRGLLFVNVSRLQSPIAVNIEFSEKQVKRMKELLKPGDIILTYSAGYMSNIFLPGKFKHGITYVGLPEDRKNAGLFKETDRDVPEQKIEKLKADLKIDHLESGSDADLIEAVAEGVIFNSLEEITKEHTARLCALRPRLDSKRLIDALTNTFLLLGDSYDFKFDFVEGSMQCCTEAIYRSLQKHGPIDFKLTKRMGLWTLSADDIVHYYLSSNNQAFDFVLYAEESPDSDGKAVILTDEDGKQRLASLMNGD